MIPLDSALYLTRGDPVGLEALLTHINPRNGSFIGVLERESPDTPLFGQFKYTSGERQARLTFLTPANADLGGLMSMLDALAAQAGESGALNLLAEVEETSPAFEALRRSGYAVYAWQQIYRLPYREDAPKGASSRWEFASALHEIPIRSLFQTLVPPIVQSAEPLSGQRPQGFIYQQDGEIRAFVEATFGPQGIYLRPLIHPDIENPVELLEQLQSNLAPILGRPVYLAIRSYYAWLEAALHALGGCCSGRQALLVKHLGILQRSTVPVTLQAAVNKQAEPTTSILRQIQPAQESQLLNGENPPRNP